MTRRNFIKIEIDFDGKHYTGTAKPVRESFVAGMPQVLDVNLQNRHLGIIHCEEEGWKMNQRINPKLVNEIGKSIDGWYKRMVERKLMRELSKSLRINS